MSAGNLAKYLEKKKRAATCKSKTAAHGSSQATAASYVQEDEAEDSQYNL